MIRRIIYIACTAAACSASLSSVKLKQRSSGERVFIEETTGREVFFHGVNAIVKGFPYIPATDNFDIDISLSEKDHATLSDLGVNVYRLGSMWKGVEPERGLYNMSYISKLAKIISAAEKYDIYTLLDMHQDDFSEKFCGEGVPDFAAIPSLDDETQGFPFPLEEPYTDKSEIDGYPTRQDCAKHNWPQYYNTKACGSAFQNLYQNKDGILDSWGDFWATLASNLGNKSAVLGYELINEPGAGDVVENPGLLLPPVADKQMLQPAYNSLVDAIRKVDQETLVFFAAVTWDDIVPVGFETAPGGEQQSENSVFAFHYYEPPQATQHTYFSARLRDSQRLHTGSMLTEFERSTDGSENTTDPFIATADAADQFLLSWTMWEYKTFCKETEDTLNSDSQRAAFGSCKTGYGSHLIWDDEGNQNMEASRKLARTYAQAVSGLTLSMGFNATTGFFRLVYEVDTTIEVPTVVFAHKELNYPDGLKVRVSPVNSVFWEELSGNRIGFFASDVKNGDKVTITLSRN